MIPQDTIQRVKNQNSLVAYLESRGLQLKKNGPSARSGGSKEYSTLCPFHDDHTPSFFVNPAVNLWHCFACDMGGDVIKFVELYDKVNFNKAIELLGGPSKNKNGKAKGPKGAGRRAGVLGGSPARPVLLKQVFEFYQNTFKETAPGKEYLNSRGLSSAALFKSFRFGFADGSLIKILSKEQKQHLKEIGVLTKSGKEFFFSCVVFPLTDRQGNLVNLYGRHISKDGHFYLPGELNGLFYPPQQNEKIIIAESVIDALTLHNSGIHNVLAIYGVNGLTDNHLFYIQQQRITQVTLCLDADESGRKAAPKLKERLESFGSGLSVSVANLPDGLDINDYFSRSASGQAKHTKEDFKKLLNPTEKTNHPKPSDQVIDGGYIFNFGQRKYRTLGLNPHGLDRLKVNLKLSQNGLFHIDTLDLYASRARSTFIETSAKLLDIKPRELVGEVNSLIEILETKRLEMLDGHKEEKQPEMSKEEKEEALTFLKSPDILKEIQNDFERCGYIGEEPARLFGYLATVSRFLSRPLGLLIVSRSAAGKSFLQDAIGRFVDPADLQKYTRITGQSLFYKEQDALKNKVLAIAEEKGAEDAIYSIRTLQSDQYLTVAVTVTDPQTGQKKTEEYQVEGPVVICITTTNPEALDFETRNRFVILTIDESREQTKKILQRQREADSLEGLIKQDKEEGIYKKHHNAQRLLKPVQVVNPFHDKLTYPDNQLQMRREQKKYLTLIKSIAFLKQYQRKTKTINNIKYVEVLPEDIELANTLAASILGRSLDELSPHTRNLLIEIKSMLDGLCKKEKKKQAAIRFTRKQICNATGWSYWQIRSHLEQLAEMEYLQMHSGRQGQRHSYELLWDGAGESGDKFMAGLIDVKKLHKCTTLRKQVKTLRTK